MTLYTICKIWGWMQRSDVTGVGQEWGKQTLMAVCVLLLFCSGCLIQQPSAGREAPTPTATVGKTAVATPVDSPTRTPSLADRGRLSDRVRGFIAAENRSAYADRHGLSYRAEPGTVAIRVRPARNASVPDDAFTTVEYRFSDGRVTGWATASGLRALAQSERAAFISAEPRVEPADAIQTQVSIRGTGSQIERSRADSDRGSRL